LPHIWLDDHSALHDHLGLGFTLLCLAKTSAHTSSLKCAFSELRAPLDVLAVSSERAREIFGYDYLLIRPDLHVAWRGNVPPDDSDAVARIALGCARQDPAHLPNA
jgi:hypothetical protein